GLDHAGHGPDPVLRIGDHAGAGKRPTPHLELGLHHQQQRPVLRDDPGERGEDGAQGDEGEVRDHEVDAGAEKLRGEVPHARAVAHQDAGIVPDVGGELVVTDVDGDHTGGAAAQQHVGEPAGGGPGVEAEQTARVQVEQLEGAGQLVRGAGGVLDAVGHVDHAQLLAGGD